MSLQTETFETFRRLVVSFKTSNKKGNLCKNTWFDMGYPGFEVEGDQKILKGLYSTGTAWMKQNYQYLS